MKYYLSFLSTTLFHIKDTFGIWPEYCNPTYVMPDKIDIKVI